MNRWEGVGGLTRDAEFSYTERGIAVWAATIAVNDARYDAESRQQAVSTTYVRLFVSGWLAEQLGELGLLRGEEVHVVGRLEQSEHESRDGKKERKTSVRVQVLNPTRRQQQRTTRQAVTPPVPDDDPWASRG